MASQTVEKILAAEQSAAEIISQAQIRAEEIIQKAEREAQSYLDENRKKIASIIKSIENESQKNINRFKQEYEQAAMTRAELIQKKALQKSEMAEELIISMIIPK